jgi:hypothetical protein
VTFFSSVLYKIFLILGLAYNISSASTPAPAGLSKLYSQSDAYILLQHQYMLLQFKYMLLQHGYMLLHQRYMLMQPHHLSKVISRPICHQSLSNMKYNHIGHANKISWRHLSLTSSQIWPSWPAQLLITLAQLSPSFFLILSY